MPLNWKRDWNSVLNIPVIRILSLEDAEALLKDQGERTPILSNKAGKDEPDNVAVEYIQYNKDKTRYGFKERHYLLPIPAKEIRLNPNMEQNAGW